MIASAPIQLHTPITSRRLVIWPRFLLAYSILHCLWFALYAFLGKGFAYTGWQPLYVSEILLFFAVVALAATRRSFLLFRTPLGTLMLCFLAWQVACCVPCLDAYGLDALRDSVIWAYSIFGMAAAALVIRLPRGAEVFIGRYARFARLYLVLGPVAWLITIYLHDWLPVWPGTSVSVPLIKGGEYNVHLAGLFAFSLQGISISSTWWALIVLGEAVLGMSNRGGLVAFLVSAAFVLLLRPRLGRWAMLSVAGALIVLTMAAFDVRFTPPGAPRELSLDVLSRSLASVVSESDRSDMENTKDWRLNWWRRIVQYTIYGPYFWTGKGYGINLAESDGFQGGTREEPLRSPHNSHFTFLARSGVPGFLLWVGLQGTWAVTMLRAFLRARGLNSFWPGVFAWLLAYWLAFMIEAAFDVSFEGPMTGIPFWTIFGLGWGLHMVFEHRIRGGKSAALVGDYNRNARG